MRIEEDGPIFTPKALRNIAQGQRSGAAAKRHPGFVSQPSRVNPNGVAESAAEPRWGSRPLAELQPRVVAARQPWAVIWNRFAVLAAPQAFSRAKRPQ
jgi:hypothetical protein